jgi:glycosyltransferase involved in cell wall biosynthesis
VSSVHHWGLVCPDGTLFDWEGKACERPVERETCASCCRRSLTGGALVDALVKLAPPETIRWADSFFVTHKVPLLTEVVRMTTGPDRLMHTIRALSLPGNLVVAPSRAAADALLRNGVPVSQVGVLPFGITPFARSPLQPELGQRPVRFLFAGRIEHVKGLHILLHALAHMPRSRKWELDIVGEAVSSEGMRYRRWLRDEELDWSRVTWHGQVEHERIGVLLAACDVLVAPSIGLELYPLVISEAFSVGRPVIATRSGASGEMVRDGVDGILVEPRNVGQLQEALESFIENPERIGEMAANIGVVQTMDEYLANLETIYADAIRLRQPCRT